METNETRVGYTSLSILANMLRDYTKMAVERKIPCEDELIRLNALENYLNKVVTELKDDQEM